MKKTPDSQSDNPPVAAREKLITRRDALKKTGIGIGALAGVSIPHVHAEGGTSNIRLAVIGCGGRGGGAALNALKTSTDKAPVTLHAVADVFQSKVDQMERSFGSGEIARNVDIGDRKFVGFDAYKQAMDSLFPGDIAILTTPCAFRWPMFEYAIEKGLNIFMEKPVCPDGPSGRRMLELNKKAKARNLKIGVGLMCRHCDARGELFKRVRDGLMGEITMMRAYRMQGPVASCFSKRNEGRTSNLMYQIQRFHSFLWLSGGSFSDFFIHNIDECCWIKDAWPVEAKAIGGRHYRDDYIDQNFDSYSVEYTFPDGTKLFMDGRNVVGCHGEFSSYAHGTKGCAVISENGHAPSRARIYKGQIIHKMGRRRQDGKVILDPAHEDLLWGYPQDPGEANPYDREWEHLVDAIRNDKEFNEVDRGVKASLVTAMGRMAAHTGQVITYDQMLNCEHEMSPNTDKLTLESDSPLMPDADGAYPVPEPGRKTDREY